MDVFLQNKRFGRFYRFPYYYDSFLEKKKTLLVGALYTLWLFARFFMGR